MLEVKDISMQFGGLKAVNQASLKVKEGSITGLIGPNGAGKTTLSSIVSGFLNPTEGQILYHDQDITQQETHLRAEHGIARTFQIVQPCAGLSVLENIVVGAFLRYPQREQAEAKAREVGIAVEGYEAALDRADMFIEAGADILFIEAPETEKQLQGISQRFAQRIPLLANMVESGDTPLHSAHELHQMGFRLVIFSGGIVRALAKTAEDYYVSLQANASNIPFMHRMHDLTSLNAILGTPEPLEHAKKYD